jgi:hypothetical protein
LLRLLQSLSECEVKPEEIIVGINGLDPQSSEIARQWKSVFGESFHLMEFAQPLWPGLARNRLVEQCKGEFICFLDDDTAVEKKFFGNFAELVRGQSNVYLFGGPNLGFKDANSSQSFQEILFSSRLASGPFALRYSLGKDHLTSSDRGLTLCNLFISRRHFLELGGFPDASCGEESFLLKLYFQRGWLAFYSSRLFVFHERRLRDEDFFRQIRRYGRGRGMQLVGQSMVRAVIFYFLLILLLPVMAVGFVGLLIYWLLRLRFNLGQLAKAVHFYFSYFKGLCEGLASAFANPQQQRNEW